MEIRLDWLGKMAFAAQGPSGHKVTIDAAEAVGGENRGPRPMELMLFSVAGCTAIDIVSILNKMRQEFEELQVTVQGERAEEHPKRFTRVNIHYKVKGKGLDRAKVERAVDLSHNKYCSASASMNAEFTTSLEIVE